MSKHLTIGSLFSGIGGFDLAFRNAGAEASWFCEKDEDCQSVLRRHWPSVPIYDDITAASNLPPVDIVCGGWPCQDLSVAGKRAGLSGDRSGLFFEFIRTINEVRPLYVVWENVPGLRTSCSCRSCGRRCADCNELAGADDSACLVCGSEKFRGRVLRAHRGADLFTVVSTFGFIGFDGAWTLLDSQYFGVAQRRQRMFGVFAQRSVGAARCAEILSFSNRSKGHSPPRREAGQRVAPTLESGTNRTGGTRPLGTTDGLVMAFDWQSGGSQGRLNCDKEKTSALQACQTPAVLDQFGVRRLTPTECERLMSFPDDWTKYDNKGGVISDSARYRMLGNSVVVNTAFWIADRIMRLEAKSA